MRRSPGYRWIGGKDQKGLKLSYSDRKGEPESVLTTLMPRQSLAIETSLLAALIRAKQRSSSVPYILGAAKTGCCISPAGRYLKFAPNVRPNTYKSRASRAKSQKRLPHALWPHPQSAIRNHRVLRELRGKNPPTHPVDPNRSCNPVKKERARQGDVGKLVALEITCRLPGNAHILSKQLVAFREKQCFLDSPHRFLRH